MNIEQQSIPKRSAYSFGRIFDVVSIPILGSHGTALMPLVYLDGPALFGVSGICALMVASLRIHSLIEHWSIRTVARNLVVGLTSGVAALVSLELLYLLHVDIPISLLWEDPNYLSSRYFDEVATLLVPFLTLFVLVHHCIFKSTRENFCSPVNGIFFLKHLVAIAICVILIVLLFQTKIRPFSWLIDSLVLMGFAFVGIGIFSLLFSCVCLLMKQGGR